MVKQQEHVQSQQNNEVISSISTTCTAMLRSSAWSCTCYQFAALGGLGCQLVGDINQLLLLL